MNNKKFLNGKILSKLPKDHSTLTELNITNSKELLNILNTKLFFSKIKNKEKYNSPKTQKNKEIYLKENDLLNFAQKDKNRTIKQITIKEKDNYLYGNYIKKKKPYKCGNVYCFIYINDSPLFTLGSQYYYPILLFLLNNLFFFSVNKFIYGYFSMLLKIAGIIIFIIVNYTQLFTCLVNEGIPSRKWFLSNIIINYLIEDEDVYNEFNTKKYQICRKCNILIDKSLKIIHCDICNLCCEFYDHHCPWVGKCIGKNNALSFRIFVYSNILFILYNIILLFIFILNKYIK
jgi:hypothetical protein